MEDPGSHRQYRVVLTDLEIGKANIVNLLAFSQTDFRPDRLAELRSELAAANLSPGILSEWRKWFIRVDSGDTICSACEQDVTLEFTELVAAEFTCPLCRARQPVDFRGLRPAQDFAYLPQLTDDFLPEADNLFLDVATLPDTTPNDALLGLLDRATLQIDQTTMNRIICRLALRGISYDRLVQLHDAGANSGETLSPLNNLGLLEQPTTNASCEVDNAAEEDDSVDAGEVTQHATGETEVLHKEASSQVRGPNPPSVDTQVRQRSERRPVPEAGEKRSKSTSDDLPAGAGTRLLIVLAEFMAVTLFIRYAPASTFPGRLFREWISGFDEFQGSPQELTIVIAASALLMVVIAIAVAVWMIAVQRYCERRGGSSMDFSPQTLYSALLLPGLAYPLYYRIARSIEDEVRSTRTQLGTIDLASASASGPFGGGLARWAANPPLLMLFAGWCGLVAYMNAVGMPGLLTVWWYLLPLQVYLLSLCNRFITRISRA